MAFLFLFYQIQFDLLHPLFVQVNNFGNTDILVKVLVLLIIPGHVLVIVLSQFPVNWVLLNVHLKAVLSFLVDVGVEILFLQAVALYQSLAYRRVPYWALN